MKQLLFFTLVILMQSCSISFQDSLIDHTSGINQNEPSYLSFDCCQDLESNYEIHICSVLKLYETIYTSKYFERFDDVDDEIHANVYLHFNSMNFVDSLSFSRFVQPDKLEIIQPFFYDIIRDNDIDIIKLDSLYSVSTIVLRFMYFPPSLDKAFRYSDDYRNMNCKEIMESFDYELKEFGTKNDRYQTAYFEDDNDFIDIVLNDFIYQQNINAPYKVPIVEIGRSRGARFK